MLLRRSQRVTYRRRLLLLRRDAERRRRGEPSRPRARDLLNSRPMVEDMDRANDFIAAWLTVSLREDRRRVVVDDCPLARPKDAPETRRLPLPLSERAANWSLKWLLRPRSAS